MTRTMTLHVQVPNAYAIIRELVDFETLLSKMNNFRWELLNGWQVNFYMGICLISAVNDRLVSYTSVDYMHDSVQPHGYDNRIHLGPVTDYPKIKGGGHCQRSIVCDGPITVNLRIIFLAALWLSKWELSRGFFN